MQRAESKEPWVGSKKPRVGGVEGNEPRVESSEFWACPATGQGEALYQAPAGCVIARRYDEAIHVSSSDFTVLWRSQGS